MLCPSLCGNIQNRQDNPVISDIFTFWEQMSISPKESTFSLRLILSYTEEDKYLYKQNHDLFTQPTQPHLHQVYIVGHFLYGQPSWFCLLKLLWNMAGI